MVEHEVVLRRAYRAFNARDIDAAVALMHRDVDWANGLEGGRVLGRDAVREYWARQFETIDPRVEPQRFATDSDGGSWWRSIRSCSTRPASCSSTRSSSTSTPSATA